MAARISVPQNARRGDSIEGWGRVGEHIATGHFAAFHRIEGSPQGPLVAEVLVDDYARMPNAAEQFLAESKRWSAIKHAAFATPVGVGRTSDGAPFAMLEAIDGIPLTAYIAQAQKFFTRRT